MAAQKRAPRRNPLIPVEPAPAEVAPSVSEAPICGQCWPGGWESLPPGADYASCEHGEWSTMEGLVKRQPELTYNDARRARGFPPFELIAESPELPRVIDGVTLDGKPVEVEIRPDGPALVKITYDPFEQARPSEIAAERLAVSPFKPKPAPEPVEVEPGELDTGDDVMFMPSGG